MTNLLEEVVLLAYDDDGRPIAPYLHMSLAGAALMELALRGRIDVDKNGRVDRVDSTPPAVPPLDEVLGRVPEGHVISGLVPILSAVDLHTPVMEGLLDRGVLTHQRQRVMGLVPVNRYHPGKTTVEADLRMRLERAYSRSGAVEPRTAALAGVLATTFMETAALPEQKYGKAHQGLMDLADTDPTVKHITEGIQLAVNAFRAG